MNEFVTFLNLQGAQRILNIDAETPTDYIAFTNDNHVITPDYNFKIDIEIRFPLIRRVSDTTFLIADSRTEGSSNLHIFDFEGQLLISFFAGDGIEDILVHRSKIIVTYFDEGVVGSDGPNQDGVAVFDFTGVQLFGFNSSAIWGSMVDCYCITKAGPDRVVFYAYPDFKVCELSLDTFKVALLDAPEDFLGSFAVSIIGPRLIFHGSYDDKSTFYVWDRSTNAVNEIGQYSSRLKGLQNGKFLTFGEKGFTIIDVFAAADGSVAGGLSG